MGQGHSVRVRAVRANRGAHFALAACTARAARARLLRESAFSARARTRWRGEGALGGFSHVGVIKLSRRHFARGGRVRRRHEQRAVAQPQRAARADRVPRPLGALDLCGELRRRAPVGAERGAAREPDAARRGRGHLAAPDRTLVEAAAVAAEEEQEHAAAREVERHRVADGRAAAAPAELRAAEHALDAPPRLAAVGRAAQHDVDAARVAAR
eukprot:6136281-Prymnesium_polylepis.3